MGEFSSQVIALFSRAASEQGGIISGDNPTHYNPSNPIRLWIIQVLIIIIMTQFLSVGLSRMRQPRVIAEVIGGVLLGPTVMGRIPHFQETIFPTDSMPLLNVTATVGLILFLFLVGLEIDTRLLKRNILASATVSIAGLIFPLGLGAALGVGVYREFIDPSVNFGYFLLFVAVAVGITAFPVLCRILTELRLLDTEVGLVVLSAGIGNDVLGWVLLALTVALVNASSGLTALWVLLVSAGYTIFLLYPGRWAYTWLVRRSGSLEQGSPTPFVMTVTLLLVLVSAFFTDVIGVHAIFGGFLAGCVIPHENGFAISIVEKIEDLVSILFLPIYFTLSGLKTNLGLLDSGKDWGYTILICVVAFSSKFFACGAAAYFNKFNWREAGAIGALMSCKGLVELIVLNIGLQAKILNDRTFSMFVVHALVLTFITTPLTLVFYPAKYRVHHRKDKAAVGEEESVEAPTPGHDEDRKTRFTVVLDKIESLPAVMTISQLLHPPALTSVSASSFADEKAAEAGAPPPPPSSTELSGLQPSKIRIDALRIIELTQRTSALLRSQEADFVLYNDPLVSIYRAYGHLHHLAVSAALSLVNHEEFPDAIAQHARETASDMLIVPWPRGVTTSVEEEDTSRSEGMRNPFDGVFHKTKTTDQTNSSIVYAEFIRSVFVRAPSDVALFVDRGMHSTGGLGGAAFASSTSRQHIFLPFFGGPDDRLALSFLIQLCENPLVSATVVRILKTDGEASTVGHGGEKVTSPTGLLSPTSMLSPTFQTVAAADTVYGQHTTQTRLASDTADNILWARYSSVPSSDPPASLATQAALKRISFRTMSSPTPLHLIVDLTQEESQSESVSRSGRALIVLLGRSRRLAVESLKGELKKLVAKHGNIMSSSVPKTLGDVGAALVTTNVDASLLVVQAKVEKA